MPDQRLIPTVLHRLTELKPRLPFLDQGEDHSIKNK